MDFDFLLILYISCAVGMLVIIALAVLVTKRLLDDGRVNRIWRSLQVDSTGQVFRQDMVADLPAPARRYLMRAIKPATPLAQSVHVRMLGALRPEAEAHWIKMRAEEIISVPKGFVWKAEVRRGIKKIRGADYYFDGIGRVRFWLWGLIPAMRMEGPDTSKSAAGRLAIEAVWLPSCLLPQTGAEWEAVDENSANVTLQIGGESATLTITVGSDGKLLRAMISRWGVLPEGGPPAYIPFQLEVEEEREFEGYRIPAAVRTGWWIRPDYYFEFFKATVLEARFQ